MNERKIDEKLEQALQDKIGQTNRGCSGWRGRGRGRSKGGRNGDKNGESISQE